jgi:hypothetical protein
MTKPFSVYYHIYLTEHCNWVELLANQFAAALDAQVLQQARLFSITAIGAPEDKAKITGLLDAYSALMPTPPELVWYEKQFDDTALQYINELPTKLDETLTLNRLWERARNSSVDEAVLYFHAKSVTALQKTILKEKDYAVYINYVHWRRFLEWSVLERAATCRQLLETHDTVGANYCVWPSPHYSGNFWWANTSYIKELPNPQTADWFYRLSADYPILKISPIRMRGELWIGAKDRAKMASLFNHPHPPPEGNLGEEYIPRNMYAR